MKIQLCIAITALTLFGSCKKYQWCPPAKKPIDLKACNILRIEDPNSVWEGATFYYNSAGKPVKILLDVYNSTGTPNMFFLYDSYGRLTAWFHGYKKDYSEFKPSDGFEGYHKYTWVNDCLVIDSSFYLGHLTETLNPTVDGELLTVSRLELDKQHRIRKALVHDRLYDWNNHRWYPYDGNRRTLNYQYDVNGNMSPYVDEFSGPLSERVYTEKRSLFSVNEIWMFIKRDYSQNAVPGAATLNCFDLPQTFSERGDYGFFFHPIYPLQTISTRIYYACDCEGK